MRRQKHCYNHQQKPERSIPGIPKGIDPLRRRKKTLERLNPLTPLLLTRLVANTYNLLSTKVRQVRRIRTREVLDAEVAGDVVATTSQQRVLTLQVLTLTLSRKK